MQQNFATSAQMLQLSSNIQMLNQKLRAQVKSTNQLGQGYNWRSAVKSQIMFHHLQHIEQLVKETPEIMDNFETQLNKISQFHRKHIQEYEENKSKLQQLNSEIKAGQLQLQKLANNRKEIIKQYTIIEQQLLKRQKYVFQKSINKIKSESISRKNEDLKIDISLAYGSKIDVETLKRNPNIQLDEQFKKLLNYFTTKLQEQQRTYHEAITKDKVLKMQNKNSERIQLQAEQLTAEITKLQKRNQKAISDFERLSKEKSQLMNKLNLTIEQEVGNYIKTNTYNKKKQLNKWKMAYEKALKITRETVGQIQDVEGVQSMINLYLNS